MTSLFSLVFRYYISQQLTDKSDVYSFGVILLELISGQEAISNENFGVNCRNIVQWVSVVCFALQWSIWNFLSLAVNFWSVLILKVSTLAYYHYCELLPFLPVKMVVTGKITHWEWRHSRNNRPLTGWRIRHPVNVEDSRKSLNVCSSTRIHEAVHVRSSQRNPRCNLNGKGCRSSKRR